VLVKERQQGSRKPFASQRQERNYCSRLRKNAALAGHLRSNG